MFSLNENMRFFLCPGHTDMRKGMNTLCGVVQNQMGQSLRVGDIFIFISRRKNTAKILRAEDGHLILYIKRLDEGTFRLPAYDEKTRSYPMQWHDLVRLIEGIRDTPDSRLKKLKAMRYPG